MQCTSIKNGIMRLVLNVKDHVLLFLNALPVIWKYHSQSRDTIFKWSLLIVLAQLKPQPSIKAQPSYSKMQTFNHYRKWT